MHSGSGLWQYLCSGTATELHSVQGLSLTHLTGQQAAVQLVSHLFKLLWAQLGVCNLALLVGGSLLNVLTEVVALPTNRNITRLFRQLKRACRFARRLVSRG
jgi:hypothetical protein